MNGARPVVEEVLRFEELPLSALASRRAVVRWSDGTESECARWYADEVKSGSCGMSYATEVKRHPTASVCSVAYGLSGRDSRRLLIGMPPAAKTGEP